MIPVRISPFFWLTAALIGFLNSGSLVGTLIWIGVIFVSILVHEYGHALAARAFGQQPRIELVAFGGLTYPEGRKISLWKEFFVVFNGPFFGFCLFVLATLILPFVSGTLFSVVKIFQLVNLFWTIVNLLPVLPLDGGQLLRIVLEGIFGMKGWRYAQLVSIVISVGISAVFFFLGAFLVGAIFFLFTFQNIDTYRRTRNMTEADNKDEIQEQLLEVDKCLLEGREEEAIPLLRQILEKTKKGMTHNFATQYLAQLLFEKGEIDSCYELLMPIKGHLSGPGKILLHEVAFAKEDYPLVSELSGKVYQLLPSAEVAFRSAQATAFQKQIEPTIGWLKAALDEGLEELTLHLKEEPFASLQEDKAFIHFTNSL